MSHLMHAMDLELSMVEAEVALLGPSAPLWLRDTFYALSNHALISRDIDAHLPSNWLGGWVGGEP